MKPILCNWKGVASSNLYMNIVQSSAHVTSKVRWWFIDIWVRDLECGFNNWKIILDYFVICISQIQGYTNYFNYLVIVKVVSITLIQPFFNGPLNTCLKNNRPFEKYIRIFAEYARVKQCQNVYLKN